MKKIATILLSCIMITPSFASATTTINNNNGNSNTRSIIEAERYPTPEEVNQINIALDKLVIAVNKKLANGETDIQLAEQVGENGGKISLGFKSETVPVSVTQSLNSNPKSEFRTLAATPTQKKSYFAYVANTQGFDFTHALGGEFTYGGGKILGATKDVGLTGLMYEESHVTWIDQLDPSVWEVNSHGKFKALKYLVQYNSYLSVKLLGSGDYRVVRADIGF